MSELGDFIRNAEYEINAQVNGTKQLAYNSVEIYIEPDGNLLGKAKKEKVDDKS